MAIPANVGEVYQVTIEGRMEGQLTANVFHFECVGADTDTLTHLILVFVQCFIDNLLPVLSSSWALERVRWKRVSPSLGVEQISIPVGAGNGGGNAAALPSYCAAVISKRTLTGGRSFRGRTYIAGIPEDQTLNSAIDISKPLWAGILGFALCVITNFVHPDPAGGSNIWNLIVFSRKLAGSTLPFPNNSTTDVREYVPVQQLGTMRSRKVGRGS